jgi:hypothetical protein
MQRDVYKGDENSGKEDIELKIKGTRLKCCKRAETMEWDRRKTGAEATASLNNTVMET